MFVTAEAAARLVNLFNVTRSGCRSAYSPDLAVARVSRHTHRYKQAGGRRSCTNISMHVAASSPVSTQSAMQGSATQQQLPREGQPSFDTWLTEAAQHMDMPEDLQRVHVAIAQAVQSIAQAVALMGLNSMGGYVEQLYKDSGNERDQQKKLDVIANDIMVSTLRSSGCVAVMASEEDDDVIIVQGSTGRYCVVFDPLDGSRNIEASIPTGSIWGIYAIPDGSPPSAAAALQPGTQLLASGYSLYSSAIMMVICPGHGWGTHGFTLDPRSGSSDGRMQQFKLTHPYITIPQRGQVYSVNDARYFDWPEGLRKYIDTIRQGKGQHPKKYSARYICSLVADLHRTLLYGGVAMNPRSHLRLVYEANPLAFLTEAAGGKGTDGKTRVLDVQPQQLHMRLPLFLGSPDDIDELVSYGDVQQIGTAKYDV